MKIILQPESGSLEILFKIEYLVFILLKKLLHERLGLFFSKLQIFSQSILKTTSSNSLSLKLLKSLLKKLVSGKELPFTKPCKI